MSAMTQIKALANSLPSQSLIQSLEECSDLGSAQDTLQVVRRAVNFCQKTVFSLMATCPAGERGELLSIERATGRCARELSLQAQKLKGKWVDTKHPMAHPAVREIIKIGPDHPLADIYSFLDRKKMLALSPVEVEELRKKIERLPEAEQKVLYLSFFNACFSKAEKNGLVCISEKQKIEWAKKHLSDQALTPYAMSDDILAHVFSLPSEDRARLASILRDIAIQEDEVCIEDWDLNWGMHHISEDTKNSSWSWRLLRGVHQLQAEKVEPRVAAGHFLQTVFCEHLFNQVEYLPPIAKNHLMDCLKWIAIHEDHIEVDDADPEWGLHHLREDIGSSSWSSRLSRALHHMHEDRRVGILMECYHSLASDCPPEIVIKFLQQSPLLEDVRQGTCLEFIGDVHSELQFRTMVLRDFTEQYRKLCVKYPLMTTVSHRIKEREYFLLMNPTSLRDKPHIHQQMSRYMVFTNELLSGGYDPETAVFLLDKFLMQTRYSVDEEDVAGVAQLRDLAILAKKDAAGGILKKAPERVGKDIFYVETEARLKAKVKFTPMPLARNELASYECDVLAGCRMTTPTKITIINGIYQHIKTLAHRLESSNPAMVEAALKEIEELPGEIKNALYGHTYEIYGEGRVYDDLGKVLWSHVDFPKEAKLKVLCRYLGQMEAMAVQLWIQDKSMRAFDMVREDPKGGEKIKKIPKVLVHAHVILDLIKGSKDSSCGNTMFMLREDGSIGGIKEFDDEYTFPEENTFHQMRFWELGLPQANIPFDRAFLLLFSDPTLLSKMMSDAERVGLSDQAKQALYERMHQMMEMFNHELTAKAEPTLTPRDLYFTLFGGREEYDKLMAAGGNPWEVFEFGLADHAKGFPAWGAEYWETVRANFGVLFSD